ncbi:MAG: YggT family protein, partial [Chitinivibrionales bacterium]|nr:YggT family protein [Chitinivibrionales bacterium]
MNPLHYVYYALRVYEIILLVRIFMSWIRPDPYHPVVQ